VIITAFPRATFLSVFHKPRFIFASIPVENSSIKMTEGLPEQYISIASKYITERYLPIKAIASASFL
jgi:hypothetical protein